MRKLILAIFAVILVSAVGLLLALPRAEPVSATALTQQADQEKSSMLAGIASGQMLYIRNETHLQVDTSLAPGPWRPPAYWEGKMWMAVGSDGCLTTYTGVGRDADGVVVSHSKIENGQNVLTWAATGDQITYPVTCNPSGELASWINGIWSYTASDPSYTRVGNGLLEGRQTVIFEKEISTKVSLGEQFTQDQIKTMRDFASDLSPSVVYRIEYPADKPLLFKSEQYDKDASGNRTLTNSHRILEYSLLPADTQIGPFEND